MPAGTAGGGGLACMAGKTPLSVAPASRSRSWPSRYALSLLRYSRSKARRSSTRRSSSSRCCTREPMACRWRSWASRSRLSALALASLVICSAWRRALPRISSASRRARPRVSSASRLASAIAWSAVCCASASTRAAVSMLSSGGGAMLIMAGSGRRSGSGIIGSGAIRSGSCSVSGELSADMAVFPPRMHSASFARSSSFSWMSRSSSTSTSSRKASTSSSSYPGLSLVVLNCLFRTSAGVSGISSPRRAWVCPLWDRTGSEQLYGVDQEKNNEEQQHEAEVQGHATEPEHRDEPAQKLQRRIGGGVDRLRGHQHRPPRMPIAGESLYPAENQPPDQEQQVDPECIRQNELYDAHGSALSSESTAGRPPRGRRPVLFVTGA